MATENKCPHCGKPVPGTALGGICPECMLKVGLTETAEVGPDGTLAAKASLPPPVSEIAPHFPQLEILECLGRGGMGVVYKARQPKLDRFVALKILSRKRADGPSDAEFAERFQREARALARLNHPDIIAVYDFGEAGGFHYLLMEYVDGLTLRQLLETRKLSPEEALTIVPKICEALQFAHQRGIVHRDIKPENILLDRQGCVKIADFGIAKILSANGAAGNLTGAKDVIGTPHYMAPEQIEKPTTVDHRADIYSLGVVFYEMLTGELPLGKFQPPSRKVHVDVRLDEVVLHALEKEPERRYQHASEVKTDVETIASSPTKKPAIHSTRSGMSDAGSGLGDEGRFTSSMLPELLPGEQVVHFKRRVWALFCRSWPLVYRLFFSLPPLWDAGLYITDRRILLASHFFGLFGQEFSIWFHRKLEVGQRELLQRVSTGRSRWLGDCLDLRSEAPESHWYRGRELLLRIYMREPEALREKILVARAGEKNAGLETRTPLPHGRRPEVAQSASSTASNAKAQSQASSAAYVAFFCACLSGLIPTIFYWLAPWLVPGLKPEGRELMAWLGLVAAVLAVLMGALARKSGLAWAAIVIGGLNLSLGVLFLIAGLQTPRLPGSSTANASDRASSLSALLEADRVRALSLFNEIEDFGHEFDAAFTAKNLPAAQTGVRRLSNLLSNFNAVVRGTGYEFPATLIADVAKVQRALAAGDWDNARLLAAHNEAYARDFRRIADRMVQLDRDAGMTPPVPPVVIETVPPSGAADVDPTLTELRVTFSKPMRDGSWAWTTWGEEHFPEPTGQPHYLADGRTCILPVKLKPGRLYATWLNSETHHDFKDQESQPAVPYLLIFETRK